MTKIKASELRGKSKDELTKQLNEHKQELNNLRVAKVSGSGAASKLARIRTVRKTIARVLTVINQTQKAEIRKLYQVRTTPTSSGTGVQGWNGSPVMPPVSVGVNGTRIQLILSFYAFCMKVIITEIGRLQIRRTSNGKNGHWPATY